jgi:hypothetical protein
MNGYFAAKMLSEISKSVAEEPAFIEMMDRENLLWAEENYSYQIYRQSGGHANVEYNRSNYLLNDRSVENAKTKAWKQ